MISGNQIHLKLHACELPQKAVEQLDGLRLAQRQRALEVVGEHVAVVDEQVTLYADVFGELFGSMIYGWFVFEFAYKRMSIFLLFVNIYIAFTFNCWKFFKTNIIY